MKILHLLAENFKRITAAEITPAGNVVEITGKNGQGKTSVLDAICVALSGLEAAPKKPIKSGALESRIVLNLGTDKPELVVTRTFRPSKDGTQVTSSLKVENAEGAKYGSPQAVLDKLLGALSFDPLAFDRMKAGERFNSLRAFVPGVDFEAIEMANRADYDKRTVANRRASDARAQAAAIVFDAKIAEEMPISETAIVAELDTAGKHNADIETRKANREKLSSQADSHRQAAAESRAKVSRMEAEIVELNKMANGNDAAAKAIDERLAAAGELAAPIDTAAIMKRIEEARAHNQRIERHCTARSQKSTLVAQAQEHEATAAKLTESRDMREIKKRESIAAAKLPVVGIGFGDNEVLLNGEPWDQASSAERTVASMQMAMAMSPKLKIVSIKDGSLLDEASLKIVADLAAKNDYQVWIERVDSSGRVGIVIEDGRVKSINEGSKE